MGQGSIHHFNAGEADAGQRADVFIASKLASHTRSSLKRLFDKQLVSIEDTPVRAGHLLRANERLALDTRPLFAHHPPVKLKVLYEDKDVMVIDKPSGVLTHAKGAFSDESTVASFIKKKITDKRLVGNRAGIVHRLDRATSGVIIVAKNLAAQAWLQKQFASRRVAKTYVSIVEGLPQPPGAIIDVPIERNPSRPQTFRAGANGKPAQTKYRVLETFQRSNNPYSLLELQPVTGRTHQIRVHLKYIGHPVVGDRVYGRGGKLFFLHAKSLEIILPNGKKVKFDSAQPKKFTKFRHEDPR